MGTMSQRVPSPNLLSLLVLFFSTVPFLPFCSYPHALQDHFTPAIRKILLRVLPFSTRLHHISSGTAPSLFIPNPDVPRQRPPCGIPLENDCHVPPNPYITLVFLVFKIEKRRAGRVSNHSFICRKL